MLTRLLVENVALAERTELTLGPGLTVLTGETGAGKSLLVDALMLMQGGRGALDLIRTGAKTAVIEATFHVTEPDLRDWLDERGIACEGDEIVFRRLLSREGRHRSYINGAQLPAALASEIAGRLLDIHGQHEQQSLLQPSAHLELLDLAADQHERLSEYQTLYSRWRSLQEEEQELEARSRDRESRLDFLRFQLEELERIAPQPGEWDELEQERKRLENADRLAAVSFEGEALLYSGDDAVAPRVAALVRRLEEAARFDETFGPWHAEAAEIAVRAEELGRELGEYTTRIEADPERLNSLHERLDDLSKLRRKHGELDAIPAQVEQLRQEVDDLQGSDDRLTALRQERSDLEARLATTALALREARTRASDDFAKRIEQALHPLGMKGASITWRFQEDQALGPRGMDQVELLFSANQGEPPRPLQKVASGGELSRIMLALHTVFLQAGGPGCVIFDEIDAGIGGEVGDAIGQALRQVAENRQVICVTHLPQIAVYAQSHLTVQKRIIGDRTVSEVFEPDPEGRLAEIGRMLSGRDDDASRDHARALLERGTG